MHRNRAFADEQGARDLAVAVALREQGKHLGFPGSEIEPRQAGCGTRRLLRPRGQPGPPRQFLGEAEQRVRRQVTGKDLASFQGPGSLITPACPDGGLGLTQPRVRLPVGLARLLPGVSHGPPHRPAVGAELARLFRGR